jgi:RNA polymerase sigma-70 factor (ECF subfamily)
MSDDPPKNAVDVVQFLGQRENFQALSGIVAATHRRAPYLIEREDLFQELMLRALKARDQFRGQTDQELLAWLAQIARNCVTDRLRRHARLPPTHGGEYLEDHSGDPPPSAPEDRWESLVQGLPPEEALLLRARYRHGLSFEQISRLTGASPEALRQRHHRVLCRLRDQARER